MHNKWVSTEHNLSFENNDLNAYYSKIINGTFEAGKVFITFEGSEFIIKNQNLEVKLSWTYLFDDLNIILNPIDTNNYPNPITLKFV